MGALTKIHIGYKLTEPLPLYVEPGSPVEGTIIVTNNGEKDLKLKELFIDLVEQYDKKQTQSVDTIKNKLHSYFFNTRGMIHAQETQEYPFKIILPKWRRKKGRRISEWHLALHFKQKTKMIASRGSVKRNATCILPVEGTMISPSFGDPNLLSGKKKRR